jgi:hypothetical protein
LESGPNLKVDFAMKNLFDERNAGLVALACLLLLPEFAKAANACLNIKPSFTYTPIVGSSGRLTLDISAQAGCFWEVVSHSKWITILSLSHGYGSGSIVFQALPTKAGSSPPGFMRFAVRDLNQRQVTTLNVPIEATGLLNSSVVGECRSRMKNERMSAVDGR